MKGIVYNIYTKSFTISDENSLGDVTIGIASKRVELAQNNVKINQDNLNRSKAILNSAKQDLQIAKDRANRAKVQQSPTVTKANTVSKNNINKYGQSRINI